MISLTFAELGIGGDPEFWRNWVKRMRYLQQCRVAHAELRKADPLCRPYWYGDDAGVVEVAAQTGSDRLGQIAPQDASGAASLAARSRRRARRSHRQAPRRLLRRRHCISTRPRP